MIKFKNNLSDEEFLTMLDLLDEDYLITLMHKVDSDFTIQKTTTFVDNLRDDIPTLLDYQSNLDEPITNYKYIKTGIYYYQTSVADSVFELFTNSDWLFYKDALI